MYDMGNYVNVKTRQVVQDRSGFRKIDVPFSIIENERFRILLKNTGRSAGPYVKQLILQAMDREDHLASLRPEFTPTGAAVAHAVD